MMMIMINDSSKSGNKMDVADYNDNRNDAEELDIHE